MLLSWLMLLPVAVAHVGAGGIDVVIVVDAGGKVVVVALVDAVFLYCVVLSPFLRACRRFPKG